MSCLKKVSLSVATLAASASIFAGADLDSRVRELEKEMKQVRTETALKSFGAGTVSARPDNDGYGFCLSFDILYWQLKAGGTEYCYTNNTYNASNSGNTFPLSGYVEEMDFNRWDWGFRAGGGYSFTHGEWDIYANYTYFVSDHSALVTTQENGGAIYVQTDMETKVANSTSAGYVSSYGTVQFVNKATSQLKFTFNRIDLELGRDFFVAKYLALRPHIGLMTAWIRQDQTSQYTGVSLLANTATVHNKNHFWGLGPRAGFNSRWFLCNGFSVIGNVSGALAYGRFDMYYKNTFSLDSATNFTYLDGNMHRFAPTAQMQLGVGYDTDCGCTSQHFSAWLGWDIQYWWRIQQQMKPRLGYARSGEDLSLQGVSLHLKWDF